MKIDRMTLETYLDGELTGAEKVAVEQTIAQDASVGNTLRLLQSQRALRMAAMASYEPRESETAALTANVLDAASAPLGRVGSHMAWIRRCGAVAAMVALAAGSFYYGRSTAPEKVAKAVVQDHYMVAIITPSGEL